MTHASLFSGIGGFDLAASWLGWPTLFSCEVDSFCRTVLHHHFPQTIQYADICTTAFSSWRGKVDVLSGGFPCQDVSLSKQRGGGQAGLLGSRSGLFFEMLRVIREVEPTFIVSENVSNLRKIHGGEDFNILLSELSKLGYNAEWRDTSASEVGAPHRRSRCYLVAYPSSLQLSPCESFFSYVGSPSRSFFGLLGGAVISVGLPWDPELPLCLDDYGLPTGLVGSRGALIKHSFMAPGNAVVPQVPFCVFKGIQSIAEAHSIPSVC